MTTEREQRMMDAALFLADASTEALNKGIVVSSFFSGVRWADKNPESPWVHVDERMPNDSLPRLTNEDKTRGRIKVFVRLKNGNMMKAYFIRVSNSKWYFNVPLNMRNEITHWMPVPPIQPISKL